MTFRVTSNRFDGPSAVRHRNENDNHEIVYQSIEPVERPYTPIYLEDWEDCYGTREKWKVLRIIFLVIGAWIILALLGSILATLYHQLLKWMYFAVDFCLTWEHIISNYMINEN